jgi:3-dehydroquinate synthase
MVTVRIALSEPRDTAYDILIGPGLLAALPNQLRAAIPASRYAVITDSHVGALFGDRVALACRAAGLAIEVLSFPAGEWSKTRETWAALSDRLLEGRYGRDSAVVALGGGVVGDVGGFVAGTYLRGIPYVQAPTTLLAMIDSSIGGKTAVDTPAGKNLVGVFHQPRLVVADLDALTTLPVPHLTGGMAEAIKHGVIADEAYLESLERDSQAVLERDVEALTRVVARSVEIKASIVSVDVRESGPRALLNFGHTVGHALEAVSHYGVSHGEAVAIGMVQESRLAEHLGIAEPGTAERIERAVARFRLPRHRPKGLSVDELVAVIQHDKKRRGDVTRLPLPRRVGAMAGDAREGWTIEVSEKVLRQTLE